MIVFVSYQRADTLYAAHAVGYALRLAGHEAFVDTGSIGGGELYPQTIAKAVSTAHVMLALIGPAFSGVTGSGAPVPAEFAPPSEKRNARPEA